MPDGIVGLDPNPAPKNLVELIESINVFEDLNRSYQGMKILKMGNIQDLIAEQMGDPNNEKYKDKVVLDMVTDCFENSGKYPLDEHFFQMIHKFLADNSDEKLNTAVVPGLFRTGSISILENVPSKFSVEESGIKDFVYEMLERKKGTLLNKGKGPLDSKIKEYKKAHGEFFANGKAAIAQKKLYLEERLRHLLTAGTIGENNKIINGDEELEVDKAGLINYIVPYVLNKTDRDFNANKITKKHPLFNLSSKTFVMSRIQAALNDIYKDDEHIQNVIANNTRVTAPVQNADPSPEMVSKLVIALSTYTEEIPAYKNFPKFMLEEECKLFADQALAEKDAATELLGALFSNMEKEMILINEEVIKRVGRALEEQEESELSYYMQHRIEDFEIQKDELMMVFQNNIGPRMRLYIQKEEKVDQKDQKRKYYTAYYEIMAEVFVKAVSTMFRYFFLKLEGEFKSKQMKRAILKVQRPDYNNPTAHATEAVYVVVNCFHDHLFGDANTRTCRAILEVILLAMGYPPVAVDPNLFKQYPVAVKSGQTKQHIDKWGTKIGNNIKWMCDKLGLEQ